ncbi:hypothetical protein AN958_10602 [Leucoagaricus sp. SymC.cos]|nr:hypothetical protein AN958_10602 [Leucoagaricus sp. SymC.cos]
MAFKPFTALVAIVAATTTFAQTDLAQCDFVFIPNGDPSDGNIVADFNYIPGFAMLSTGDGGEGFIQGATYTEDPEGVFNVHNAFSKVGWTCAQTADFQESLAGQTLPGATGFLWTIQSAECSCDN